MILNPLSANPTKWSNMLKQISVLCELSELSVFDHFWGVGAKRVNVLSRSGSLQSPLELKDAKGYLEIGQGFRKTIKC